MLVIYIFQQFLNIMCTIQPGVIVEKSLHQWSLGIKTRVYNLLIIAISSQYLHWNLELSRSFHLNISKNNYDPATIEVSFFDVKDG